MNVQEHLVCRLSPFPFVKKIILFGSRARGDHQTKSDFDIAIDCPEANFDDWIDLLQTTEKIPTLLSIQIIRYNTSSKELQDRIKEEGVILYEQKS